MAEESGKKRPPRLRTKWYVRHKFEPEEHEFIYRVIGLGIVEMHFESYEQLASYSDSKYAAHVNWTLTSLVDRLHTLNVIGDMLWPKHLPERFNQFPISRYQWLMVALDAFLVRYVSIVDCAALLINEVLELNLRPEACTIRNLEKRMVPARILGALTTLRDDQGHLRAERNRRIHHGVERALSSNHQLFRMSSLFDRDGRPMHARDEFGRWTDADRLFDEALVDVQRDFNRSTRLLKRQLDVLYDELEVEFEARFHEKFHGPNHAPIPRSAANS